MTQPDPKTLIESTQRQLVIMWPAFISTIVICLFIPHVLPSSYSLSEGTIGSAAMRAPLWVVSLMVLVALWWWNSRFLTSDAILKSAGNEPGGLVRVLRSYLLRKIVAFALAEAIAIYGLVLTIIVGHVGDQYVLTAISGLSFIFLYPSRTFLVELIQKTELRTK